MLVQIAQLFGIVSAFVLGILLAALPGRVVVEQMPAPAAPTASTTLSVATTTQASSTAPAAAPKAVSPAPPPPSPRAAAGTAETTQPVAASATIPAPAPTAPPPAVDNAALDASASVLRAALVNIICYAPSGSSLRSISGSGVIIDSKGIILTNAHIAQHFLLSDLDVSCVIRSGSPAVDKYEASLVYIPSEWVRKNADILTKANPIGTGEHDFALLAVTKSVTKSSLPISFPFIPLATTPVNTGMPVVIASYGAQFLESSQIQSYLFPTIVFGKVKDVLTFVANTIDVLSLGGSVAAQEGSSGGGVADSSGKLVGTITTSTTKGTTDTRKLDAITASYIRAEYASETGQALDLLLAQPTEISISDFAPQIPALESILTAQLP